MAGRAGNRAPTGPVQPALPVGIRRGAIPPAANDNRATPRAIARQALRFLTLALFFMAIWFVVDWTWR